MDTWKFYLLCRVVVSALFSCVVLSAQGTGQSYMTYYFSADGTRLYATTVTAGQMPGAYGVTHRYTAYTNITGPSGTQAVGCGTANSGFVPAQNYNSVQESCYIDLLSESDTYDISWEGTAFCSAVGRTFFDTGNQQTYVTTPRVTIQVQSEMQQGANGFVLIGNQSMDSKAVVTTNLTATGSPSGGTFAWSAGPKLSFQGLTNTANAVVVGTNPSVSAGDTWVSVKYSQNGVPGYASIRFTVREPYTLTAQWTGGPTKTFPLSDGSGYVTWISYQITDQPALNTPIGVDTLPFMEICTTVSNPNNGDFDPPDGVAGGTKFDTSGFALDRISAYLTGGHLPPGFSARRNQALYVNGNTFLPQQQQIYTMTYGYITTVTLIY